MLSGNPEKFVNTAPNYAQHSDGAMIVKPIGYDDWSNAQSVIEWNHSVVHQSKHFRVDNFTTVNSGSEMRVSFLTPSSETSLKVTHGIFTIYTTNQTEVTMYEGTSYDVASGGTEIVPKNSNRCSPITSVNSLRLNPVITNTGTLMYKSSRGLAGTNPVGGANEGTFGREDEWVLCPNTNYLFLIQSKGVGNIVAYHFNWYESVKVYPG